MPTAARSRTRLHQALPQPVSARDDTDQHMGTHRLRTGSTPAPHRLYLHRLCGGFAQALLRMWLCTAALHIKHLKPLARGASKKRTSLAPTKPTGPKVLGQRNTTSTESQDAIVRLYDTFIMFSAAGGHIALRQHIALLLVRHQSADCPRGTHAVWPGRRARSPDPHHRCTAWAS